MGGKKQYRLLMIDDDAALNELLVEYFERFGHKLATAVTAADGRRRLRQIVLTARSGCSLANHAAPRRS